MRSSNQHFMSETYVIILVTVLLLFAGSALFFLIRALFRSQREQLAAMLEQARYSQEKMNIDKALATQKQMLPIRLQAYERLILFLERIHPASLVMRVMPEATSAKQFQALLLQTIREEFEHNLVQQLYVSETAWSLIKAAREEMVQTINLSAAELNTDAKTDELAGQLVIKQTKMNEEALKRLKTEVKELF